MEFCGSHRAAYEKLSDDVPFELPKGWAWCRLDAVCEIRGGKRIPAGRKLTETDTGHKYIRVSDMRDGSVCTKHLLFVPPDIYPSISKYIIKKEDIFITVAGTLGRVGKIPPELDGANLTENADRLILNGAIIQDWLIYVLNSQHVKDQITSAYTQVGQPKLAIAKLAQFTMPLPPLAEQKKAVARINELYKVADSFGEAAAGLEAMAKRLDKKILDLAIRGKLMPQNPNDEPASELLKRIAATSHKSPCKNHETPIEPPFAIPESWEWVRLGNVSDIIRGTGIKRSETSESGVQCVRYGEIYTDYGYSFSCSVSHVPLAVAEKCHEATFGDVLCTLTGENEVEIAKATAYLGKDRLVIGGDLAKITNHPYDPMLLVYFLFSPFMISQKAAICTGGMIVHMGKSALSNLLIPLPPLAEQKRIVSKIEELRKATQALTM